MEKKEINTKTSVKAIITGFIAYGIIIGFLSACVVILINAILASFSDINELVVSVTLPLIGFIILYFLVHALCRMSTYDVFKKCKTKEENIDSICRKMNAFFLICIIFSVVLSIIFFCIKFDTKYQSIQIAELQYSEIFSESHTTQLVNQMLLEYNSEKTYSLISTIILEFGFTISILSLVPFQKKMLETYNDGVQEVKKKTKKKKSETETVTDN